MFSFSLARHSRVKTSAAKYSCTQSDMSSLKWTQKKVLARNPCCASRDDVTSGQYGSHDMPDDMLTSAYDEALQIFSQARTLSELQVKMELEQAFASETSSDSLLQEEAQDALSSFWVEQGLSQAAATRLSEEIRQRGQTYTMNQLSSKVLRWQRLLPDADIGSLMARDPGILDADVNSALLNMIALVEAFPGLEIMALLIRQPRLLWSDDLRSRVSRVLDHIYRLHPSKDMSVVREIVFDNPELLFRMDYYQKATLIDELPIEIQNMMILADQGIGYLYRYYNNRSTNYKAELTRNNFNMNEF
ncbi:hypothetical protein CEUSTIGMA_g11887.t1 [Chlamydomonas eustigma]|uniref:Uncharacterized protein n=1 Tax=Chlamydomonas eustigma TaxID=1157962 RepID=A0A250XN23_9CHLO|nr:hypothetical protein CEUSTIGMA_g11887.t1 [Chlamydomonas eustigma]|eukprot:GAX84467.1 hypothetical protein CEUSTIGMA_g11887.t1 [Chlamydomonas eustigma]